MGQRRGGQRQLFENDKPPHLPQVQQEVQQEATRLLVQWMEALAKVIGVEVRDEQDKR